MAAEENGTLYTSVDSGETWNVTSAPVTSWMGVASSADGSKLIAVRQYEPLIVHTNGETSVSYKYTNLLIHQLGSYVERHELHP